MSEGFCGRCGGMHDEDDWDCPFTVVKGVDSEEFEWEG